MDRNLYLGRLWIYRQRGDLTLAAWLIGRFLLSFANRQGVCWPSHATLAAKFAVSVRTVQRAKDQLESLGFLTWQTRRARWNRFETCTYQLRVAPLPADTLKKDSPRGSSEAKESDGSPPPAPRGLERALASLGRAIGEAPARIAAGLGLDFEPQTVTVCGTFFPVS